MVTKLCLSHSTSENAKYDIFKPICRGAHTLPRPQSQVRFASKISEVSQGGPSRTDLTTPCPNVVSHCLQLVRMLAGVSGVSGRVTRISDLDTFVNSNHYYGPQRLLHETAAVTVRYNEGLTKDFPLTSR